MAALALEALDLQGRACDRIKVDKRVFRDRSNPLDMYNDAEMQKRYRFSRRGVLTLFCHETQSPSIFILSSFKGMPPSPGGRYKFGNSARTAIVEEKRVRCAVLKHEQTG